MTNRHHKLWTVSAITAVISLVTTIVLSAPASKRDAHAIGATQNVRVHEYRTLPVAGLGRLTVHVWRRGTEVQVAALDERGAMVVLRGGAMHDGTSNPIAPKQDTPSARVRTIDADGTVTVEECANESCARTVAERASAVAAKANLIPYVGTSTWSLAVRMCPSDVAGTATRTSIPHWVRAGVDSPCKWQIVSAATLAAWPVTGRADRVWVGDTEFQIHRAPLRLMHGE